VEDQVSRIEGLDADVHFGSVDDEDADWRSELVDVDPDDEELAQTPDDVIAILGFDPLEEYGPRATKAFCATGVGGGVDNSCSPKQDAGGDKDLRGANLRGKDLRGVDLESADLREADLRDADLRDANAKNADMKNVDARSADMTRADLRKANLESATLRNAYLDVADLSGANLSEADMRSVSAKSASFKNADLRGAVLTEANLSGADLRNADLREANLRSTHMTGARLRGAKLDGALLQGADFGGADLDQREVEAAASGHALVDGKAWCPTGPGGGRDNSCSPKRDSSQPSSGMLARASAVFQELDGDGELGNACDAQMRGGKFNKRGTFEPFSEKTKLLNLRKIRRGLADLKDKDSEAFELARQLGIADRFGVEEYADLPDKVTVYRGHSEHEEASTVNNVTTRKEVAEKFGETGVVTEYEMSKDDIIFPLSNSVFDEGEMIVHTKSMKVVSQRLSDAVVENRAYLDFVKDLSHHGSKVVGMFEGAKSVGKVKHLGVSNTLVVEWDVPGQGTVTDYLTAWRDVQIVKGES
jgi:uncharacterized protein YjbI with pentapeptide repeats